MVRRANDAWPDQINWLQKRATKFPLEFGCAFVFLCLVSAIRLEHNDHCLEQNVDVKCDTPFRNVS
jgi:hypothetical protein